MLRGVSAEGVPGLHHFAEGAVMFADVSGFTPLSEELARHGKRGAEELTRILNAYFEDMIGAVEEAGGDVCKFGGDAMTVLFEKEEGEAESAHALRVLRCARGLQARMKKFERVRSAFGKTFALRMKIGVAAGESLAACLGKPPRRAEYVLAGGPVDRCAEAEHHASAGQVVADAAMKERAGAAARWRDAGGGFFLLEDVADASGAAPDVPAPEQETVPDGMLSHFVAPQVRDAMLSGRGSWLNEHRRVAVIFLQFEGLDMTRGAEGLPALARCFEEAESVVSALGGCINRVDLGDKGSKMIILFGAPAAMEDNEGRALLAASRLRAALARVKGVASTRMGLTCGKVFCGNVGASSRYEYTVMGDYVNLAARLMTAAGPGEIFVHAEMEPFARSRFACVALPPMKVKGKSAPIEVLFLGAEETAEETLPAAEEAFLGREEERGGLREAVEAAARGEGSFVSIEGEAGAGKSRLAAWAHERMRGAGFRTFYVQCHEHSSQVPFFVWARVFESMLGLRGLEAARRGEVFSGAALRLLPGEEPRLYLLAEALGVDMPRPRGAVQLDERLRRENLFDLALKLLAAFSQKQPVGIRIEDSSWVDSMSRDFMGRLAARCGGLALLLTETHRQGPGPFPWHESEACRRMTLGPLEAEDFRLLAEKLLGGPPEPELLARLDTKSRRIPLYLRETVAALQGAGALERMASGRFRLKAGALEAEIPATLQQMALSRLDRLPLEEKTFLKTACCLGRYFEAGRARALMPQPPSEARLKVMLDGLRRQGLLEPSPAEAGYFLFSNVLYQEAAYETLPYEMRRSLHAAIAESLERERARRHDPALLAWHFYQAGAEVKAFRYSREAAGAAQRRYANREAVEHYQRCLELLRRRAVAAAAGAGAAVDVRGRMGQSFALFGDYGSALAACRGAFAEARRGHMHEAACGMLQAMSEVEIKRNRYAAASRLAGRARGMAGRLPFARAKALQSLGFIAFQRGRREDSLRRLRKAEALFASLQRGDEQATCRYYMSQVHFMAGDLAAAEKGLRASLALLRSGSGKAQRLRCHLGIANVHRQRGEFAKASREYGRAMEITRATGDKYAGAAVLLNWSGLHYMRYDFESAGKNYAEAETLFQELGTAAGAALCRNNAGNIRLLSGRYAEAAAMFEGAAAIQRRAGDRGGEAMSLANLGEALFAQGRWGEAEKVFLRSLAAQRELKNAEGQAYALAGLAWARWKQGDAASARRHAREGLARGKKAAAAEPQASLHRLLGEMEGGEANFRGSLTLLEGKNNLWQEAQTLVSYAAWREARGDGAGASETRRRALRCFETLHNETEAAALREALETGSHRP
jgi:class 3 adenylate cyclase/tetratricopeptide (TPR) repeat protein